MAATNGDDIVVPIIDPTTANNGGAAAGDPTDPTTANGGGDAQQRDDMDMARRKKMKCLNGIVFCIAFLEWAGNAVGTVAFLWATVVLLGGFCTLLSRLDFWIATVMILLEGSRVFIRNDASVNQWLFGSTSAFRWEDFSFPRMFVRPAFLNIVAVFIGVLVAVAPEFQPEIAAGILKVVLLVIISQFLTRLHYHWFAYIVALLISLALSAVMLCAVVYALKKTSLKTKYTSKEEWISSFKLIGLVIGGGIGTVALAWLTRLIMSHITFLKKPVPLACYKFLIASGLACLPILQPILASRYKYFSIAVAVVLLILSNQEPLTTLRLMPRGNRSSGPLLLIRINQEPRGNMPSGTSEQNKGLPLLLLQIVETILPILFFWSVMFPLQGISLQISFYMLFAVVAAVLIANLQIPVAFLQVLLSIMRLLSLLGHHHHHDYSPLPPGASPNLVPSIVVFFVLELCQGSSYIVAVIVGLISVYRRIRVAHDLEFKQDWGPKALNLYFCQAYKARTEKGLFRLDKDKHTPSLESVAIQSLGCSSSYEMQIVGLRILDHRLQRADSKPNYNNKLITEIVKDAKNIITKIIGLISYLTDEENSGDTRQNKTTPPKTPWDRIEPLLTGGEYSGDMQDNNKKNTEQQKEVLRLPLEFVRRLAIKCGKISATFRKELWKNAFFLDSLLRVLDLKEHQAELWEPVMDIIATLAWDEDARKEIGSNRAIILKLMSVFLIPSETSGDSLALRKAAGKALGNLTITTTVCTDNCCDILFADQELTLIKNLIDLLVDEGYMCVAANLLHNLCANSRGNMMDISLRANGTLESALPKVIQMVKTKEGKQLEAALCVASQIGYVIPECFVEMLKSYTDAAAGAAAAELVEKLVNTLKFIREPCPDYPRIRRLLVEVVISIVEICPSRYKEIFVQKGMNDALDMVKGTPSRLEKYRVFLDDEGVVAESKLMRDLINEAKKLINLETSTPGAQPVQPLNLQGSF